MLADPVTEWNKTGSIEQLLKVFKDFDPALKQLISKVDPQNLKVWRLLDMETLPTFSNGKLALLGDAAHPFTPRLSAVSPITAELTGIQIKGRVLAKQ